jgi:uncharacterized protein YdhG (YjbR/CyaY superfamily)
MAKASKRKSGGGTGKRRPQPPTVDAYLAALADERRRRAQAIRAAIHDAVSGVAETMRYRMPTFEKDGAWVAFASQKQYLAVYFCSAELIASIRAHHPELDCGVGCVRIRDAQHVPIFELREAFARALAP